jgi:hypothetical protein
LYASRNIKNNEGTPISLKTKLLATLRYLAGGSKWDICLVFGIGFGSFFADNSLGIIYPILDAIDQSFSIGLDLDNDEVLKKQSADFANIFPPSAEIFNGVILAIDGWVMRTRQPYASEVDENVMSYRNRKGCWGIVVLAACDAKTKFHMFSANNTGSTNDCTAWSRCQLKKLIDEGRLNEKYYLIGDEGLTCENQLITPWSGVGIGVARDSFNFHLSVRRQTIERAFGILTRRWGVFWRDVNLSYSKWALLATVCAKLHNFCIDRHVVSSTSNNNTIIPTSSLLPQVMHPSNVQVGDIPDPVLNGLHIDDINYLPRPATAETFDIWSSEADSQFLIV